MADNLYDIESSFSQGCSPAQLQRELVAVWPAELSPVDVAARGPSPTDGAMLSGTRLVRTAIDLDRDTDAARQAVFSAHVPVKPRNVILLEHLRPGPTPGFVAWVDDAPRATAADGLGCNCYYDDRDNTWRRVSDDGIVREL